MQKSIFFIVIVWFFSLNAFAEESTGTYEMALTPTWPVEGKYFGFLENTTVKKQGTGEEALFYSKLKYGDLNSFLAKCLKKCAKGKKGNCGGVVVAYYTSEKKTPRNCHFKERGATTKSNKNQVKDYFQEVCYEGGLYTANCKHLNLGACWDKSITTIETSDSPWRVGNVDVTTDLNLVEVLGLEDCRRTCAAWDDCYLSGRPHNQKAANAICVFRDRTTQIDVFMPTAKDQASEGQVDMFRRHSMCK